MRREMQYIRKRERHSRRWCNQRMKSYCSLISLFRELAVILLWWSDVYSSPRIISVVMSLCKSVSNAGSSKASLLKQPTHLVPNLPVPHQMSPQQRLQTRRSLRRRSSQQRVSLSLKTAMKYMNPGRLAGSLLSVMASLRT